LKSLNLYNGRKNRWRRESRKKLEIEQGKKAYLEIYKLFEVPS
jgi:hypothetical protein